MVLRLLPVVCLLLFTGCSTLKGWFTAQGQKVSQARELLAQGHPHEASALAVEALLLEPGYEDAESVLAKSFAAGQREFLAAEQRWTSSSDPGRWDVLFRLYKLQDVLARDGLRFGPAYQAAPVDTLLREAARGASAYHFAKARDLLAASAGPRQARRALAEGRVAGEYDPATEGLSEWLEGAREAATQRLLVVPFFYEGSRYGPISGPIASRLSRKLLEEPGLPELTTIFSSDRLVTLIGGGPARIGLISQPDALKLAAEAGQNVVLLGQITRAAYQEPRAAVKTSAREKKVVLVDPEHPQGIEKVYKAVVTTTVWSTSVALVASFSLIEGPTGRDLLTAVRESSDSDQSTLTTFTGDEQALTADDLAAVRIKLPLRDSDQLWASVFESLAGKIAETVRDGLR